MVEKKAGKYQQRKREAGKIL